MNIPTEPMNAVNGTVNTSGCPVNTRPAPALDQSTRTEQYETEGQAA